MSMCHTAIYPRNLIRSGFHSATNFGGGGEARGVGIYSMLSLEGLWDMFFGKFLDASRLLYIILKAEKLSVILCTAVIL